MLRHPFLAIVFFTSLNRHPPNLSRIQSRPATAGALRVPLYMVETGLTTINCKLSMRSITYTGLRGRWPPVTRGLTSRRIPEAIDNNRITCQLEQRSGKRLKAWTYLKLDVLSLLVRIPTRSRQRLMMINPHSMSVSTSSLRRSLRAGNRSGSQTGTRLPRSGYGNRGWDGMPGPFGLPACTGMGELGSGGNNPAVSQAQS